MLSPKVQIFYCPPAELGAKEGNKHSVGQGGENKNATDWLGRAAGSLGLLCSETPTAITVDLWWSVLGVEVALSAMT